MHSIDINAAITTMISVTMSIMVFVITIRFSFMLLRITFVVVWVGGWPLSSLSISQNVVLMGTVARCTSVFIRSLQSTK